MAITSIGPTGTVNQAGFSQVSSIADGMASSLPSSSNCRPDRVVGFDRRVSVMPGSFRVPGIRSNSSTTLNLDLPANSAGHTRYDWVVWRHLWTADPATVTLTYVQGTAGTSPVAPALVQVAGTQWDLPVALVRVDASVGQLPADAVSDARYWDMAGLATMQNRTTDPPHRPGRELFIVNGRQLLVSDGTVWSPVNFPRGSGGITAAANFGPYGGSTLAPGYVTGSDGHVSLVGMIKRADAAGAFTVDEDGDQIGTVPVGVRPAGTETFPVASRIGTLQLDVTAAGQLILRRNEGAAAFPGGTGYVSLSGISYYI